MVLEEICLAVQISAPSLSVKKRLGCLVDWLTRLLIVDVEYGTIITRGDCNRVVVEGLQVQEVGK